MTAYRLVLQELKEQRGTTSEVAERSGISEGEALLHLRDLNNRVKDLLGYETDPIVVGAGGAWKADGVAGLLRLNSRVEIEIVPKFLNPANPAWRSDFFLLAVLVRTGHLLIQDDIAARAQDRGDIATLVARSLLTLHAANQRRPIRGYRRVNELEFALDGDVEWESVALPDADGFSMSRIELSRQNPYNATIVAAFRILLPEVADDDTEAQMRDALRDLGPQQPPPPVFPALPQRHAAWQSAYDVARMVVEGLGLDLSGGTFAGPGFVLSTWAAWQSLCEEVVRRALPGRRVVGQMRWTLGYRGTEPVYATPDISPLEGATTALLLDAKYKTRTDRKTSVSAPDVYESLAFLRAANAQTMSLLFPSARPLSELPLGEWAQFDGIRVEPHFVEGIEIQIQGISSRGGLDQVIGAARRHLQERMTPAAATSPAAPLDALS